jgi:sugar lactone lactonase YvrE
MRIGKIFLTAAVLLGVATVTLRSAAAGTSPKTTIFVDNSNYVTAYPLGSKGDVVPLAVTTDMTFPGGIARDASGRIYVTNPSINTVSIYAANASGNVSPLAIIGGSETRLANPTRIALDASGKSYVLNTGISAINAYPALGAGTGILNEPPVATISGSETMLASPAAIAVDASGDIYVANSSGGPAAPGSSYAPGAITVYPAGSNGDVPPSATIVGAATGLIYPAGIALDSSGDIYVANDGATVYAGSTPVTYPPSITIYPADSVGNAAPSATITGTNTGLGYVTGIALDSSRNIYTTNSFGNAQVILSYPAGSNGNIAPSATITGAETGLSQDNGIALDADGNLYVSNGTGGPIGKGSVTIYAAGSSGDAAPTNTVTSIFNGLLDSYGIAVDSTGEIYVTNGAANSVEIFAPDSLAIGTPTAIIAGANTGLDFPISVALDSNDNIYVLNFNATIAIYPPNSSGDVSPKKIITFDTKGNLIPTGIAVGPEGTLYVANEGYVKCNASGKNCHQTSVGNIGIFAPGSERNASAVIAGVDTNLASPSAIAVSSSGKIFVANQGGGSSNNPPYFIPSANTGNVTVFAPGSEADAKPIANITGSHTGLGDPVGIAVDAHENIYVLNGSNPCGEEFVHCFGEGSQLPGYLDFGPPPPGIGSSILVFKAGSNGDAKPIATIDGTFTDINGSAIAIGPAGP